MASQKPKILVTGADGLVGSRFIEKYKAFYDFVTPQYPDFDLTNPDSVMKTVIAANPDWIVHFAAYTDVGVAENGPHTEDSPAWQVNVEGTKNLLNSFFSPNVITISTDMVFPGTIERPGPYSEDDIPSDTPDGLTWYGWTKNRAEKLVRDHGGSVLRIIYPVRAKFDTKPDYIRGYLKRHVEGKGYPVFTDQQICIAFIDEIAESLHNMIEKQIVGEICHAASDTTSPYELLSYVVDKIEHSEKVKTGSIHEFLATQENKSRYPIYGGLKTVTTEKLLDMQFSTWQTIVEHLLAQGLSY